MKKFLRKKPIKLNDTRKYTARILFIFLVLFLIILVLFLNISKMNKTLNESTEQYVADVIEQLSADVSFRMDINLMYVEQLANSIERMPSHLITEEFLEKRGANIKFDQLILVDTQGKKSSGDTVCEPLLEWLNQSEKNYEKSQIAYIGTGELLFLAPVQKQGEENKILIGMYENKKIQEFLNLAGFGGKGISYIADKSGEIVISPGDVKLFKETRKILKDRSEQFDRNNLADKENYRAVDQIIKEIHKDKSGLIYLDSAGNMPIIISYYVLGINDWVLFSMLPQNILIEESETYMQWTTRIIVAISIIMIFLLLYAITNYRKSQQYLEQIAFYDSLTGGRNNASFQIQCKEVLETAPPKGYTIVFLNIRGFKHINENFGVEEGNKTLKYIYHILISCMQEKEFVTRSESDRFFLFMHEGEETAVRRRLDEILKKIYSFAGKENIQYSLIINQGAYIIDNPDMDIRIIQDRARTAAGYQREGNQCVFYDKNLTEKVNREIKLDALFEESIQNGDFQLYLQPKVSLKKNEICGAEALVRWIHPEYGMIYPSDFIPLFEKNGKICRLDIYMFEEVCKLVQQWKKEKRKLIPISVNLSRRNIGMGNFLQKYVEIKEKYDIPDSLIEFELTESLFFDNQQIQIVKQIVNEMHVHGFLCSLDDFGFGYSSLALLKEVDVDTIKLDRQFFFGDSDKMWKVVKKLISLAKELGIHIVAEGIETSEQIICLKENDCDMVQGYIYSKPITVSEFMVWFDTYGREK